MISASQSKSTQPWRIIRLMPEMERQTVAQFRSRNDADGYLQLLKRSMPNARYALVYDSQPEATSSASQDSRFN